MEMKHDSSDDESELGIALNRDRRSNAGARMSRLLEAEDEDEFYKTTYGGFTEEADDEDYKSEETNSDITDSDIDINEDDELKSDNEDSEKKERKKFSSVYKDPKKIEKSEIKTTPKDKIIKIENSSSVDIHWDKKSIRKSTAEKSKCTEGILKEREAKAAASKISGEKKRIPEMRRLTQEELLSEAKITEEINLASLETYQKMELAKKKLRSHRQTHMGPTINYYSVTLPITTDETIDVNSINDLKKEARKLPAHEKCARNFITFTDGRHLKKYIHDNKISEPSVVQNCIVTGLPAKYLDPLTLLPYATADAFKVIREAYKQKMLIDAENEKKQNI